MIPVLQRGRYGGQLDRALEEDGAQFWPDDVSLIGESASDC